MRSSWCFPTTPALLALNPLDLKYSYIHFGFEIFASICYPFPIGAIFCGVLARLPSSPAQFTGDFALIMNEQAAFARRLGTARSVFPGTGFGLVLLLCLAVISGCSGGGDRRESGPGDQKSLAQNQAAPVPPVAAPQPPPAAATPAPVAAPPQVKPAVAKARPAGEVRASLGLSPEEFRQRFNKNSEREKSKLRLGKIKLSPGAEQDTFRHVFNDNLNLAGKVGKDDGSLREVTVAGVLNGSLAAAVDVNTGMASVVTALSQELSPAERGEVLNTLGINNKCADIYSLDKRVTKKGITYWVKSSRKDGIRLGVTCAG